MKSLRRTQRQITTTPTRYPNATFVKTEKGYFYIVSGTKRYRIISERVLASWSPPRVVGTTEAAVSKYRIAAKMKFRNGSLIWNLSDGKVYLVEEGKRRWVRNPDVFNTLGLDPTRQMKEVMCVSQAELDLHPVGEDLT